MRQSQLKISKNTGRLNYNMRPVCTHKLYICLKKNEIIKRKIINRVVPVLHGHWMPNAFFSLSLSLPLFNRFVMSINMILVCGVFFFSSQFILLESHVVVSQWDSYHLCPNMFMSNWNIMRRGAVDSSNTHRLIFYFFFFFHWKRRWKTKKLCVL